MDRTGGKVVLVLGAYGLIGEAVARALHAAGHTVRGLGRDPAQMARLPWIDWQRGDLTTLTGAAAWAPLLAGTDMVVNAAGALQDGAQGQLAAIHHHAIAALAEAAPEAGVARIIQISAVGATPDAPTAFLATKAAGDAALRAGAVPATILRPGLVLARSVYGGTALLRLLAAFPWVQPIAMPGARIQVIGLDDLAAAVTRVTAGDLPERFEADLVADAPVTLGALVRAIRAWLGFPPARMTIPLPAVLTRATGRLADGLGRLGWRSPLRTTALKVLASDVTGDPAPWRDATGRGLPGLADILDARPATLQDRWHARLYLLLPIVITGLAAFWIASGVIGLIERPAAMAILTERGTAPALALMAVIGGALADIALGGAVLFRRWARRACLGMIALSLGYLAAGTLVAPDLWLDPLGPLVKVIPAILLAATAHAMLEPR